MDPSSRAARHSPDARTRLICRLCLGGDWACAHGDLAALADIAARLVTCSPEALRGEIAGLSSLCSGDLSRASAAWLKLRNRVLRSFTPPS